jgi:hypothetical protein
LDLRFLALIGFGNELACLSLEEVVAVVPFPVSVSVWDCMVRKKIKLGANSVRMKISY